MIDTANPTPSSAAASARAPASRPLELLEARQLRDSLKSLLRTERSAMADFLVALADFDRGRGWERLGHASLFAFLVADLRLSKSAAYYRRSAADLLQDFPEVIAPLREGRLCLSTVGELAKVLTEENRALVTPRFFGLSSREAQELVAELQPREVPSTRMVVTRVLDRSSAAVASTAKPALTLALPSASTPPARAHPDEVPPWRFPTSGLANGGGADGGFGRPPSRRDEIVPLTADLRRLHITVCRQFLRELESARDGLSHAIPNATTEQVLQEALRLLLEKQARARGEVKRPRKTGAARVLAGTSAAAPAVAGVAAKALVAASAPASASATAASRGGVAKPEVEGAAIEAMGEAGVEGANEAANGTSREAANDARFEPSPHRRDGHREAIPAAVRRAVWARDGGRCSWPLDGGGCCGSTRRLELDHLVPWAEWGGATEANLRVVCAVHNRVAARVAFGERWMGRYGGRRA
jgi:hypothetical protein